MDFRGDARGSTQPAASLIKDLKLGGGPKIWLNGFSASAPAIFQTQPPEINAAANARW
jgi:hypothetical protein